MSLNRDVFRKYDVRGVSEIDFSGDFPFLLGKAFGSYIIGEGGNKIAVSGDVRLSTARLKKGFINGLIDTGINVVDIGILPTPVNYFSNYHLDIDGSVQITGSHNPSEYNGFKFTFNKKSFFGDDIQKLYDIIIDSEYKSGKGSYSEINIITPYIDTIVSKFNFKRNIRVIMDCGNAAGCIVAPEIFKKLGINLEELYCDIDGTFPNHHPDPTVDSNLEMIVQKIKQGSFDLGIAYDGDADRVICIDSKGNIIRSDILMCFFIQDVLRKSSVKKIIYDVKCSSAVKDIINKFGGEPIEWKTGHSLIKNKMHTEKAPFGGEMSGHIFFADRYYGYDDALYAAVRLLGILAKSCTSLFNLCETLPKTISTPEIRFPCDDSEKFRLVNKVRKSAYAIPGADINELDGVRVTTTDGWWLLRASNTQPVLVVRFESWSDDGMMRLKDTLGKLLAETGIDYSMVESS